MPYILISVTNVLLFVHCITLFVYQRTPWWFNFLIVHYGV